MRPTIYIRSMSKMSLRVEKEMNNNKKIYNHYEVEEQFKEDGSWCGYRCSVVDISGKKQGKLYIKTDGRHFYQEKPKDNELEI